MRLAKSMRFESGAFSDESRSSNSSSRRDVQVARRSMLKQLSSSLAKGASQSARLRKVGKSLKQGVSRMRKIGKRKCLSEPNLVVCIDGKGDRLGPSQRRKPGKKRQGPTTTQDESETRSNSDSSQDQESQSGHSEDSSINAGKCSDDVVSSILLDCLFEVQAYPSFFQNRLWK